MRSSVEEGPWTVRGGAGCQLAALGICLRGQWIPTPCKSQAQTPTFLSPGRCLLPPLCLASSRLRFKNLLRPLQ